MKYLFFITLLFFFGIALYMVSTMQRSIPDDVRDLCLKSAAASEESFKDTKWAQMDFYQSCVDNIMNTSPTLQRVRG